jgi:hypothetical protein
MTIKPLAPSLNIFCLCSHAPSSHMRHEAQEQTRPETCSGLAVFFKPLAY